MARKHHDEATCVRSLSKKSSIRIQNKCIEVIKNCTDVGNGSWGKIDFLTKVCGYTLLFVKQHSGKQINVFNNIKYDQESPITAKDIKRERKFNMAFMAKTAMKRVKTK